MERAEDNTKVLAIVEWYDNDKGIGIAKSNNVPLLIHSIYFKNGEEILKAQDVISCIPVERNSIYHATHIEVVKRVELTTLKLEKQE